MVIVLGGLVALLSLGNLLVTTLASGTFACLLVVLYEQYGPAIKAIDLIDSKQGRQWRMTAPRFVLLLIGSTVVAFLFGTWLMNGIQIHDNVAVIAHRGAASKAPENTLASVRQAMKDGADWIEIDVQESIDGEVVVIHDSDFMKLAGVDLKVWDSTLKELREIDVGSWFGPEFSAERVPTLAKVLEETRGQSSVLIELKYYGHDQQLEQRVVDIVEKAGMVNEVAVMSLKHSGIKKFHALRPDWVVGLLSSKAIGNLYDLDMDFFAINMGMATPGFIRNVHLADKQVFVWTVNDQVSMSRMISLGVDGIITDEPELARNVLVDRSKLSSIERLLIHTAVLFGQPIPQRIYRDQSP
jgi:glycerophosphoryl diester phosphodiesterase